MPEIKEGGVNVTPLIDIVMCLIIFFMLVAKIGVSTGADASIEPPETVLGIDKIEDIGNTLTLNVTGRDPQPEPIVTALIDKSDAKAKEVKLVEQRGTVRDEPLFRVLKEARARNDQFSVVILADRELPYHMLEAVLTTCTKAQIKKVHFQTKPAQAQAAPAVAAAAH